MVWRAQRPHRPPPLLANDGRRRPRGAHRELLLALLGALQLPVLVGLPVEAVHEQRHVRLARREILLARRAHVTDSTVAYMRGAVAARSAASARGRARCAPHRRTGAP